jgi:hypothetical protein
LKWFEGQVGQQTEPARSREVVVEFEQLAIQEEVDVGEWTVWWPQRLLVVFAVELELT